MIEITVTAPDWPLVDSLQLYISPYQRFISEWRDQDTQEKILILIYRPVQASLWNISHCSFFPWEEILMVWVVNVLKCEDGNCDRMIDRPVYSDRKHVTMQQSAIMTWQFIPKLAFSSATHSKVHAFSSQKEYVQLDHSIIRQMGKPPRFLITQQTSLACKRVWSGLGCAIYIVCDIIIIVV